MDIAGGYPEKAGINTYKRIVDFKKSAAITITDVFQFDANLGEVVLSLMTYEKPMISGNNISVGTLGTITVNTTAEVPHTPSSITTEEITIDDARLGIAWKHNIYRILITVTEGPIIITIS